jgi:hypothetical protein
MFILFLLSLIALIDVCKYYDIYLINSSSKVSSSWQSLYDRSDLSCIISYNILQLHIRKFSLKNEKIFYLVSELILLDINQKYFKWKNVFSMDDLFTKKCCNHNQIDTMNKHHAFYVQFQKCLGCSWNLNLAVVYTDNMMNIPIHMPTDHFFWQFSPG